MKNKLMGNHDRYNSLQDHVFSRQKEPQLRMIKNYCKRNKGLARENLVLGNVKKRSWPISAIVRRNNEEYTGFQYYPNQGIVPVF